MIKTNALSLLPALAFFPQLTLATPFISGELGYYGYGSNNPYYNLFYNRFEWTGVTGRIGTGYLWDANSFLKWGFELGFTAFSNIAESSTTRYYSLDLKYKKFGTDALAIIDCSLTSKFDIFVKAGATYTHQKSYTTYFNPLKETIDISNSEKIVVPKAVIGVGYNIADDINLNLSMNHEFLKSNRVLKQNTFGVTSISMGIRYLFY